MGITRSFVREEHMIARARVCVRVCVCSVCVLLLVCVGVCMRVLLFGINTCYM